jgi:hypothetical protein
MPAMEVVMKTEFGSHLQLHQHSLFSGNNAGCRLTLPCML